MRGGLDRSRLALPIAYNRTLKAGRRGRSIGVDPSLPINKPHDRSDGQTMEEDREQHDECHDTPQECRKNCSCIQVPRCHSLTRLNGGLALRPTRAAPGSSADACTWCGQVEFNAASDTRVPESLESTQPPRMLEHI